MKFHDAVIKVRELGHQMQEHAATAERAATTYQATMMLYNVAADAGDEQGMQQHRDALHTTVDVILDSGAMIAQLKKEQLLISSSVTDFPQ